MYPNLFLLFALVVIAVHIPGGNPQLECDSCAAQAQDFLANDEFLYLS
jgi:hypothetical protein